MPEGTGSCPVRIRAPSVCLQSFSERTQGFCRLTVGIYYFFLSLEIKENCKSSLCTAQCLICEKDTLHAESGPHHSQTTDFLHCVGKVDIKKWSVLTHQGTLPPAGTVHDPCSRPGIIRKTRGKEIEIRGY